MHCPCGEDHEYPANFPVDGTIPILVPERNVAYKVPRVYIAAHGLKAADLEQLAQQYGWERL
jgi:hypothetical protein